MIAASAVGALGAVVVALAVAPGTPPSRNHAALATCRRLEQAFETEAMASPCRSALDDHALPVAERVEAGSHLAFALVTNGDVDGGVAAFLDVLVLAPRWSPPASASPRLRDAFARARARLDADGRVRLEGRRDHDRLLVTVTDPLARVARMSWRPADGVDDAGGPLTHEQGGLWSAALPADVAADVVAVARSADGSELGALSVDGPDAVDDSEFPWLAVGAGAGAVVVVGAAVGTLVWALNGPLAPPGIVTVSVQ